MNDADSIRAGTNVRSKLLGIFGGTSSSLGAFGAAHSVCHYTCQAIVVLLAIAGISVAGMPLGFLLDARLVVLFSALGLISVVLGVVLHTRLNKGFDRKVAIFALFAIVSTVSLASGIHDLVAKEGAAQAAGVDSTPSFSVDAAAKTNNQGDVAIEISYQGISTETLVFRVAMDSMKMDAPPLPNTTSPGWRISPASAAVRSGHLAGASKRPATWATM